MMCSKAVVLVGGFGTRLRPLTYQVPKPLVPIAGIPLMDRIVRRLETYGFTEVVLAVQYLADQFYAYFAACADLSIKVTLVEEPIPLGTAGAVRYALMSLGLLPDEPVLILNGDEVSSLDWRALCDFHAQHAALATIAVREVEDPSRYGVVVRDMHGYVLAWQEKPQPGTARALTINSGAYVLNPALIDSIAPGEFAMFERDVFPRAIAQAQPLQTYLHNAYSQDIGTLDGYLAANAAVLLRQLPDYQPLGIEIQPGIWIAPGVDIHPSATLHPPVILGAGCVVGAHVSLDTVVAWEHVTIEADSLICNAALATGCSVPPRTTIEYAAWGPQTASE